MAHKIDVREVRVDIIKWWVLGIELILVEISQTIVLLFSLHLQNSIIYTYI